MSQKFTIALGTLRSFLARCGFEVDRLGPRIVRGYKDQSRVVLNVSSAQYLGYMQPIVIRAEFPFTQSTRSPFSRASKDRFPTSVIAILLLCAAVPLYGREHKTKKEEYGLGYTSEIAAPINEVLQAVDDVVNNSKIDGSKEYNKDKFIDKAFPASSSSLFPERIDQGQVFFKVREKVLAPVNFKDSNDEGTLAVRYVVRAKTPQQTIVRIDAVFVEDFRRTVHPSNGNVESAEFKDIQDDVDAIALQKKLAAESEKHRQEELAKQSLEHRRQQAEAAALAETQLSSEDLEQHVEKLRRQLEMTVKASGAHLKSAPFQTATNLQSLDAGAQVVILIVSPYWYGVETENGQHGWINRAELEPLP